MTELMRLLSLYYACEVVGGDAVPVPHRMGALHGALSRGEGIFRR